MLCQKVQNPAIPDRAARGIPVHAHPPFAAVDERDHFLRTEGSKSNQTNAQISRCVNAFGMCECRVHTNIS